MLLLLLLLVLVPWVSQSLGMVKPASQLLGSYISPNIGVTSRSKACCLHAAAAAVGGGGGGGSSVRQPSCFWNFLDQVQVQAQSWQEQTAMDDDSGPALAVCSKPVPGDGSPAKALAVLEGVAGAVTRGSSKSNDPRLGQDGKEVAASIQCSVCVVCMGVRRGVFYCCHACKHHVLCRGAVRWWRGREGHVWRVGKQ